MKQLHTSTKCPSSPPLTFSRIHRRVWPPTPPWRPIGPPPWADLPFPKRRWYQFSLRTLLVVATMHAILVLKRPLAGSRVHRLPGSELVRSQPQFFALSASAAWLLHPAGVIRFNPAPRPPRLRSPPDSALREGDIPVSLASAVCRSCKTNLTTAIGDIVFLLGMC